MRSLKQPAKNRQESSLAITGSNSNFDAFGSAALRGWAAFNDETTVALADATISIWISDASIHDHAHGRH